MSAFINILPGWVIAILLFGLLWAASVGGNRLRDRLGFTNETIYATSAAVSLLVLLIGFTFSLALNRYDSRRALVVEETSAIFAVWERLPLENQPARAQMMRVMREYVDQRLYYFTHGIDADNQARADAAADQIMDRMWEIVRSASEMTTQPLVARMMMDNLGRIDDVAWRREDVARAHIPFLVIDLLVIFSLCTAASMGVSGPADRRIHPTHLIFFALNSAAIMLVLDLDQPRSGLVLVSQRPMLELKQIMANDAGTPPYTDGAALPSPVRR